jgi:hypothetical protein
MAMAISVAADWEMMGDKFYRKQLLYAMQWAHGTDLGRHKVACSRFGGAIAIIRDDSKIVQLRAESARPRLSIFSSAGALISSTQWDRPGGRLVALGWTEEETLACIVQDGTIFMYNIHGELLEPHISMGKECWDQGVSQCVVWDRGVVCLTERNELFSIPDLRSPHVHKLANPSLDDDPFCMVVIEPQFTRSGDLEVLLAGTTSVARVDMHSAQEQGRSYGPIQRMALSPTGTLLACFTYDGRLLVLASDFSRLLSEFDTQVESLPFNVSVKLLISFFMYTYVYVRVCVCVCVCVHISYDYAGYTYVYM